MKLALLAWVSVGVTTVSSSASADPGRAHDEVVAGRTVQRNWISVGWFAIGSCADVIDGLDVADPWTAASSGWPRRCPSSPSR